MDRTKVDLTILNDEMASKIIAEQVMQTENEVMTCWNDGHIIFNKIDEVTIQSGEDSLNLKHFISNPVHSDEIVVLLADSLVIGVPKRKDLADFTLKSGVHIYD